MSKFSLSVIILSVLLARALLSAANQTSSTVVATTQAPNSNSLSSTVVAITQAPNSNSLSSTVVATTQKPDSTSPSSPDSNTPIAKSALGGSPDESATQAPNATALSSPDESSTEDPDPDAEAAAVPYAVEVVEEGYGTICGGVIIGHTWVLIDGWCTLDPELDKIGVRAGSSVAGNGTLHRVSQWVRHPSFNAQSRTYDVALLNVFPAFEYGEHVYNALLPTTNEVSPDGALGIFSGWGTRPNANKYRGNLKSSYLYIFREEACQAILGGNYAPTKLCARETFNNVSLCWFDNGGPLVSDNVVYGIGIFPDRRCSDPRDVKIFTRVAAVRDWIDEITKHNLYLIAPAETPFNNMPESP